MQVSCAHSQVGCVPTTSSHLRPCALSRSLSPRALHGGPAVAKALEVYREASDSGVLRTPPPSGAAVGTGAGDDLTRSVPEQGGSQVIQVVVIGCCNASWHHSSAVRQTEPGDKPTRKHPTAWWGHDRCGHRCG